MGLNPLTGFLAIGTWLSVFVAFRISSLSALVTMLATIIASMVYWYDDFFWPVFAVCGLVIFRHKANIQRLLSGAEK
jgi:glycerol-3-phosphate acyltransferase PlsY